MALISLQEVSLGFGGPRLLENVKLQIERGEMVGLLGRNGMGKSTLLKLMYGELSPDSGSVARQQNLRVAYLPQEVPQGLSGRSARSSPAGWKALTPAAARRRSTGSTSSRWSRSFRACSSTQKPALKRSRPG